MNLKKYKTILYLFLAVITFYTIHKLVFYFAADYFDIDNFYYSIEILYLFFVILSTSIILILIRVKEKNLDQVGMAFLFATSVKMIFCYLLLRPILSRVNQVNSIEKPNFFMLFILFLAIETVVTIRILNNKQ